MNETCEVENNVIVFRCKKIVLKYSQKGGKNEAR